MCGLARHEARARRAKLVLAVADLVAADLLLQREHEPGTDRLDDAGRATLLADGGVGVVDVFGRADEQDRSAARHRRYLVSKQRALGDQDTRCPGATDELMGRDEHRVLVGEVPIRDRRRRVHVDREVRSRSRVVEAGERAMPVKGDRDPVHVAHDSRHVRRGGEAADLDGAPGVAAQFVLELGEIDRAGGVLADRDEISRRLSPREFVGVVLVGPDEHHRPVPWIQRQQAAQLVDRAGRAGAAEDDHVIFAAVHRLVDDAAGLLAQRGGPAAGRRCLGVCVAVRRQHLIADDVFDERQRPAGRGRVGIDDAARTERAVEDDVIADHRSADALDQDFSLGTSRGTRRARQVGPAQRRESESHRWSSWSGRRG